ncbi:MAG: autotransporter-associated beta strand repeat-containing protein [Pirellulales bacterium]|nr:autotransporter-associated beta strand repeat-containing protein [Pirellulales bacterium]
MKKAAKPGASDTAIFNIETVNTAQTVNLNAAQAALGLAFNSTGPVSIQTGTGTNTLTLGSGGITVNPGAGANTITAALNLSAPQTWTNNSNNLLSINGSVTHGANALTIAGSGNTAINGVLVTGYLPIIKNGAGTLSLNAASDFNFTGDLLINAGNLVIGNPGALFGVVETDLAFGAGSTGTFTLNGNNVGLGRFSTNAMVGTPVVQNASSTPATLTVGRFNTPTTFAGVLRDGVGLGSLGLRVQGPLTLSGNNQHTGLTEVAAALTLQSTTALGSTAGGTLLNNGGQLDLNGLSILGETLTVQSGGQLRNASTTPANWTGNIVTSGTVNDFGIEGIGDINLSGGISHIGAGGVSLVKSGPNTLELSGTSDNDTVALTVTDGVVRLAKTGGAGIRAVDFDVFVEGGTVQLAGTGDQIGASVVVNSGTFDTNGRNESTGSTRLNGSGVGAVGALVNSASGDSTLTGDIQIQTFTRIGVTQSGATLTVDGNFSVTPVDFQKVGLGTLVLNSTSNYSGDVFLSAGTIALGSDKALGIGQLVFGGGVLRSDGAARTINNAVSVDVSGTVGGSLDLTLTGVVSGSGNLIKDGSGRLTLAASNTFNGTATVNAGSLSVTGSIAGNATVNNGGSLAGTGAIAGTVTLNSGGVLAPGASAGEITLGALTTLDGATLEIELGGLAAGTQHDQVESSGTVALEGTLAVSLTGGFTPSAGQSFDFLNWATQTGAFDTLDLPALGAGLAWDTSLLYSTGALAVVTAVFQEADFDEDGDVDSTDLMIWDGAFDLNQLGDADGDNDSDGNDFLLWQRQLGSAPIVAAAGAVPEPSGGVLTFCSLLGLWLNCRAVGKSSAMNHAADRRQCAKAARWPRRFGVPARGRVD